jgi:hypothetical protein
MRVVADIANNGIIQVEKSPPIGNSRPLNGLFVLEVPFLGSVDIDETSYMLPIDGSDVSSLAFDNLVDRYAGYTGAVFNTLLRAEDVNEFDMTATVDNNANEVLPAPYTGTISPRAQTGRGSALPQPGLAPLSTALLPPNTTTSPQKPGCLITDTIDVSTLTGGAGTSRAIVWWKVYRMSTSHDISATYGAFIGQNGPAIRSIEEIDQETSGFVVAISFDDGIHYEPVAGHMACATNCVASNFLRLAFLNTTPDKIYISSYALLI